MEKPILSISMIVKNEERNLERCLDSFMPIIVEPWCELVVVDTGSTDRTVEIAEKHLAKVYHKKFTPWDFAAARNYGIKRCTGEWLFILDADEVLPQGCLYKFKDLVWNPEYVEPTKFVWVKNFFSKNNRQFSNLVQPRIFKNVPDFEYNGKVHNKPNAQTPYRWPSRDIWIEHYGYKFQGNEELTKQKYERSLPMLLDELKKKPHDTHIITHLIKTYRINAEWDEVIKYGELWYKEMEKVKYHDGWFAYLEVFVDLIDAYLRSGNISKALNVERRSWKYSKRIPDIHMIIGAYYGTIGKYKLCRSRFEKAIKIATTEGHPYEQLMTSNVEMAMPRLMNWLAVYYYQNGDYKQSGMHVCNGVNLQQNLGTDRFRWDVYNAADKLTEDGKADVKVVSGSVEAKAVLENA